MTDEQAAALRARLLDSRQKLLDWVAEQKPGAMIEPGWASMLADVQGALWALDDEEALEP